MSDNTNHAAWCDKADPAGKLQVREAPCGAPEPNEILVKVHAWAVNPIDYILAAKPIFGWLQYPLILGADVAGQVTAVGSELSNKFQVGDRVIGQSSGFTTGKNTAGGYQDFCLLEEFLCCKIPESLSYTEASVLPLGASTAACALFEKDTLALELPLASPKPTGRTILVWGASSSVGSNAVQMAVAAGYTVFATGSPKNFDLINSLGAAQVFDYNSPSVVTDIIAAIKETDFAGIMRAIGDVQPVLEIAQASPGSHFIASSMALPEQLPTGVQGKMVFGNTLAKNEVGPAVWGAYLPQALAVGAYQAVPKAKVVGKGLECVQSALDLCKQGVSASKLVVVRD